MIDVEISRAAKGSGSGSGVGSGAEASGSLRYASVSEARHAVEAETAGYADSSGRAETAGEAEALTADSATRGDFLPSKEAGTAAGEITFSAGLKVGSEGYGIGADGSAKLGAVEAGSVDVSGGATVWGGAQIFGETSTEDITNSGKIANAGDIVNSGSIANAGDILNEGGTVTTKNLTVTGLAKFFELVVGKVRAVGGNVIVTPGDGFTIDAVEDTDGGKRLYWLAEKDGKATRNGWEAGDFAVSRSFNSAKAGSLGTAANKYWWAEVSATSGESPVRRDGRSYHYIDVKAEGADGELSPEAGDEVAQLGNKSDAARQGAIVISAYPGLDTDIGSPSIAQYTGINDFKLSTHRKSWWGYDAAGNASNRFVGETYISSSDGSEESVGESLLEVRNDHASLKTQFEDYKTSEASAIAGLETKAAAEASEAAMSARVDGVEAKVATSVQYDAETKRITSDVRLSGDRIVLEGAVTANKEFRIDKWGNVLTGTTLQNSGRYIVEDISNMVFTPETKNSGTAAYVFLPNDPEYIGRRIEIVAQPYVSSAGVLESGQMTVCVRSGRTLVNYVYGTSSGDGADGPDAYAGDGAGTLAGQGLEYFGGGYETAAGLAPSLITLRGGHVTLLGIACKVSRMWKSAAGRIEAVDDRVFKPGIAWSADGRIDDGNTGWSGSGADSSVGMDGGTEYDGGNSEAWTGCAELCRWVIVDENGAELGS